MSTLPNLETKESKPFPWWWLVPGLVAALAGVIYWLVMRRQKASIQPVKIDLSFIRRPVEPSAPESEPAVSPTIEPAGEAIAPARLDDLTRIIGIGPKIARVLREAGVETFRQLAETDIERIKDLLRTANMRLADPSSWPDQARLAAAGRWEELRDYVSRQRGEKGV